MTEQLTNEFIKKRYNSIIETKYHGFYEHFHWLDTYPRWIQYRTTFDVVWKITNGVKFDRMLEVGPGPGTWTKCFLFKHPHANFTLVDISKEMLQQNRLNLGERENLSRLVADFEQFNGHNEEFDLFFSSRCIEYSTDKSKFVKAALAAMKPGASGFIITKTPRRSMTDRLQHTAQISPSKLKRIIEMHGGSVVRTTPVTVRARTCSRFPKINLIIWKWVKGKEISSLPSFMRWWMESYIIEFRKV